MTNNIDLGEIIDIIISTTTVPYNAYRDIRKILKKKDKQ